MTRYARSAGVAGQSKTVHNATPWAQLKSQKLKDKKKSRDEKFKLFKKKTQSAHQVADSPLVLPRPKPPKSSVSEGIAAEIEKVPQRNDTHKNKKSVRKSQDSDLSTLKHSMDKIRNDLKKEGRTVSHEEEKEMAAIVKKAERSELRRKRRADDRDSQKVCFKCRETGHDMSSCPTVKRDTESGTGICFKCGSTEHTVHQCRVRLPPGEFPFAKCFICGENGHLSKQCPDNPRGLYPNGGCCKFCGSVEHFKSSCPELLKEQGIQDFKLHKWRAGTSSADDDLLVTDNKPNAAPKAKIKVVKF